MTPADLPWILGAGCLFVIVLVVATVLLYVRTHRPVSLARPDVPPVQVVSVRAIPAGPEVQR